MEVTRARERDLPDTVRLFKRTLRDIPFYNSLAKKEEAKKYTVTTLAGKLLEDSYSVMVASQGRGGEISGFCFSRFDDYTLWIDWYGVDVPSRRRGVGAALLRKVCDTAGLRRAHKVWCDTRTNNEPSKNLLRKFGFEPLVEIKNHWYGEDFILWEKFV